MKRFVLLPGLAAVLVAVSAVSADTPPRVLDVTLNDPRPWGQGPRDAVVVSPGQKLAGTIALDRLDGVMWLRVRWVDSYGRVGAETTIPKVDALQVPFELPLDHPVATRGWVEVILQPHVSRVVTEPQGPRAAFVVHNRPTAWDEHHIFVWAHYPTGFGDRLRDIGITGHMTYRHSPEMVAAVQTNDLFTYVDNIHWPIFSGYLKQRDRWQMILRTWSENPRPRSPYSSLWWRDPCISDPGSLAAFDEPMRLSAEANRDGRLMFYNMVDEVGLGVMSSPTNFCWAPASRRAFGQWLRGRYGTLAALNRQWGTQFGDWNEVLGFHPTFEAMFDRLYGDVLLARSFGTVEKMNTELGGSLPDFKSAADFYAATRTSRPVAADALAASFKTVEALNQAFGSRFKTLDDAAAFYGRFDAWTLSLEAGDDFAGWNLSPWCDFREFMDGEVANAIGAMRRIGRRHDPAGRFGITGTHAPSAATGQNYELLADQLDVLVPYETGSAARILHGLRPEMIVLRPVWPRRNPVAYAWARLLDGDDGTIYWDNDEPGITFLDRRTGEPTDLARTLAPVHRQISRGLGKQVLSGRHEDFGIAVYYSHPTVRVDWWRRNLGMGRRWYTISSGASVGRQHTAKVRHAWCDLIENLHLQYRFISGAQAAAGGLDSMPARVLVLPETVALGDDEIAAITRFARGGGVVIADRLAGVFDGHGRARESDALAELWKLPTAHLLNVEVLGYDARWRSSDPADRKAAAELRGRIAALLPRSAQPPLRIVDRDRQQPVIDPVVHVWNLGGGVRLVGLANNWSEYGFGRRDTWSPGPRRLALRLPAAAHVWDVKASKPLGRLEQVALDMGDDYAAVLALADGPLPPVKASLVRDGRVVRVVLDGGTPQTARVVRVDVLDPAGKELPHYAANVRLGAPPAVHRIGGETEVAADGRAEHVFALALNDPPGDWRVVVRDILTGQTETLPLRVAVAGR